MNTINMKEAKRIALVAHDNKKKALVGVSLGILNPEDAFLSSSAVDGSAPTFRIIGNQERF